MLDTENDWDWFIYLEDHSSNIDQIQPTIFDAIDEYQYEYEDEYEYYYNNMKREKSEYIEKIYAVQECLKKEFHDCINNFVIQLEQVFKYYHL